jgi:hypothetical protein
MAQYDAGLVDILRDNRFQVFLLGDGALLTENGTDACLVKNNRELRALIARLGLQR